MNDSTLTKNSTFLLAGIFFAGLIAVPGVDAHKVSSASVLVEIDTKNQTYQVGAAMEVAPSEDQALNDLISPEDAARTFAEDYLTILFDKDEQKPALEIHTETASDKDTPPELQRKQVIVNLSGKIPKNAKEFLLYIDTRCPMAVVMVYIKDNQPARRMQVVLPGEFSRPFNAEPVIEGDPFEQSTRKAKPELVSEKPKSVSAKRPGPFRTGWNAYLDGTLLHVALLAAILLLGPGWWALVLRACALELGQLIGLTLAVFGIINPPQWGFTVLAVGVIALASGAIFGKKEAPSNWWLAPVLFLGVFQGASLSLLQDSFIVSLGFIVSLLGFWVFQLICGTIIALLIFFLSRRKWYRVGFSFPVATVLAGYGLFLLIEDLM